MEFCIFERPSIWVNNMYSPGVKGPVPALMIDDMLDAVP